VTCSTEYEQSHCEPTRRSFQSVRNYEEIRGAFDSNGGRRPERSTSTTVNGDCTTSRRRNVWHVRLDGGHRDGDRHRNTSLVIGVVWRQKSTKLEVVSTWKQTCNRTSARLQSLVWWHFG